MDQQPRGREKNVTGKAGPLSKRGEGLGTGPVGRSEGYAGRTSSGGSDPSNQSQGPQRSGGRSGGKLGLIIIAAIVVLVLGGKFGLGGLLGGGGQNNQVSPSFPSSLFSGFTDSTSSSGWSTQANTGVLNKEVAPGSREKRTVLYGNGRDHATVMVYLCGTDLESKSGMASSDLKEMASASLSSNIDVLVYTGGCKAWKTSGISNTSNQIYKIENGRIRCLVNNDGNDSMTKSSTLARFIKYCSNNYPANRNILVMWDHGGGSISGFGYDERNAQSGSLSLKGIDDALTSAGVKFDIVGFDACLMGTLENALMLEKHADYLIGSEETEPGVGWYHTNWLNKLSLDPAIPSTELGKTIIDDFVSYCNQKCPGQKTTLSLVDLAELSATVPKEFTEFATETADKINSSDFKVVSDARKNTREFAVSSKTDQVDLVHLALNINTKESGELANAILGAVKYNKTSSSINNAYGLAIYFPYKKSSRVPSALKAYESLGIDSKYAECVRSFASLEAAGQVVATDTQPSSPFPSLFGNFTGTSASSSADISTLLGGLLSGSAAPAQAPSAQSQNPLGGLGNLAGLAEIFLGGGLDVNRASDIISENQLDTSGFVWIKDGKDYKLSIGVNQWKQIHSLQLNVFYDDGEGYIDLGLDNVYRISDSGELISDFDGTWLAIDGQVVPYYYIDTVSQGDNYIITGRVPVLLNGSRANLILAFDNENPYGYIAGARYDYKDSETETIAKGLESLTPGDKIEFVCDYYSYDGEYQDSYLLGDELIYSGEHEISNLELDDEDKCSAIYMLTDIYNNEYWTPAVPND